MTQLNLFLFGPPRIAQSLGPSDYSACPLSRLGQGAWADGKRAEERTNIPIPVAREGERGRKLIELGTHKALALLVYLAVTKQTHSRDALATMLWPDADQSTALGYLRRALYRVNQALEDDVLLITRKTAELNYQADIWLDIDVFQGHANACLPNSSPVEVPNEACISRLAEAAELYTDDFLAGFTLPDSPDFDEWQFFQAESLRSSLGQVLHRLAYAHQAQGQWKQAINYARRWVALDPLEEPAQRCLMELYARADQQAAALRQYAEYRRVLDEQLGVSPEDETTALYEAIKCRQVSGSGGMNSAPLTSEHVVATHSTETRLQGQPVADGPTVAGPGAALDGAASAPDVRAPGKAARPGPPHNLPVQAHPFIGRALELVEVRRRIIDDPDCRLLTATGPGGIGKTRLALEVAHGALRSFSDGVWLIPLASLTQSEQVVPAIAEQIGLPFSEGSAAKGQLLHYLREKQMLLVLDNFEHLLPGAGLIAGILGSAPEVKILITSRERLNLSGETVYVLGGMAFPENESSAAVLEYGAAQLLVHCARLARPDLEIQAKDMPHIARICRLVKGMPLALVLAAGWLEVLSFKDIADEIAHSLDFLEGQLHDLPERQHSVRAAFEYSWKRLSPADQQAFMRLSVFRDSFTRQAARSVAGAGLQTLRTLIDKSLISTRQDGRYEIHDLLRQYGEEQLRASGEAGRILDLHSRYFLAEVSQREAEFKGGRQSEALDKIDVDLGNIRAAWDWALRQKNEEVINQSIEGLYLFFTFRGRYQEGVEFFNMARQRLASCPEDEPTTTCGRLLARLAWLQSLDPGVHENIEPDLTKSLTLAKTRGDQAEIAFCLLQLGCYHRMVKRDPVTALRLLEQSLEAYQALDDPFYTAVVLHWLGSCHAVVTGLDTFISFTRQSLELARETGNKAIIPYDLRSLTLGALCTSDYAAAEDYCREALILDGDMGLRMGLAESKSLLSLIHLLQGDLNQSRVVIDEGLEMAREVGYPATTSHALAAQSLVKALTGDSAASQQLGTESLNLPSTFFGKILANWGLSIANCDLEQYDAAWRHLREALKYADRLSCPGLMIWPIPVAAAILAHRGQCARAVEMLSLASNHPMNLTGWMACWKTLAPLHADLEAELGTEDYQAAWERGRGLDLETAVAEIS